MSTSLCETVGRMASVLTICLLAEAAGADRPKPVEEPDRNRAAGKLLRDFLEAPTGLHRMVASGKLFKKLRPAELKTLQAGRHDGLSLQIAWRQVVRDTFARPRKQSMRGVRLDRRSLQRFVGFIEGRLRASLPDWWEQTVLGARAFNRQSFTFPVDRHRPYRRTKPGLFAPVGTDVKRTGKKTVVQVGTQSLTIPRHIRLDDSVSVLIQPEYWYLAVHGSTGGGSELHCIKRATGAVRWKTKLWANGSVIVYGGGARSLEERIGLHAVSMQVDGGRLLVFGAEGVSMYIEGFRLDDGANLFRFCTAY